MFTGIVAGVGRIASVERETDGQGGVKLLIDACGLPLTDVALGDSIAVNGACMTVVALTGDGFRVDVSGESLARTCGLDAPGEVNLEKSLRLGDALGGHLVSGHIDGIGTVLGVAPAGQSSELVVCAAASLAPFITYKGSITVNGVSLTINRVTDGVDSCEFSINLIPHTLSVTTLRELHSGSAVNLEVDMIARYVERVLAVRSGSELRT
jgi:riboflavin synthase